LFYEIKAEGSTKSLGFLEPPGFYSSYVVPNLFSVFDRGWGGLGALPGFKLTFASNLITC
jgi:hypothetical protein